MALAIRKPALKTWHWSTWYLIVLLFIAMGADFIANDKPLYAKAADRHHWPVVKQLAVSWGLSTWSAEERQRDWRAYPWETAVFPIVPFRSDELDVGNMNYTAPGSQLRTTQRCYTHWLGTDAYGRDVAAGWIHGARISLMVGLLSMLLAMCIGVPLGAYAGYFGNARLQVPVIQIVLLCIGLFLGLFWSMGSVSPTATVMTRLGLLVTPILISVSLGQLLPAIGGHFALPVDNLVMRTIEVVQSIPVLLLLLVLLSALQQQGVAVIILIIALVGWPRFAKYTRAEFLLIREQDYIASAKNMGFSHNRIIWQHAMPNAWEPVWVAVSFGVAGAILAEATLSFLGIGMPDDMVSWGSQLQMARAYVKAWWLAVFPGLGIFFTVYALNEWGDKLQRKRI